MVADIAVVISDVIDAKGEEKLEKRASWQLLFSDFIPKQPLKEKLIGPIGENYAFFIL